MSNDIYNSILDASAGTVQGLFLVDLNPVNIKVRKLPKATESLDSLPLVVIAPSETPEEITRFSFEDDKSVQVVYSTDIVIIAADNRDFSSNIRKYLRWREQIRRAFQVQTISGVPSVFQIDIRPFSPLNRSMLNKMYAYSGLSLRLSSAEQISDN